MQCQCFLTSLLLSSDYRYVWWSLRIYNTHYIPQLRNLSKLQSIYRLNDCDQLCYPMVKALLHTQLEALSACNHSSIGVRLCRSIHTINCPGLTAYQYPHFQYAVIVGVRLDHFVSYIPGITQVLQRTNIRIYSYHLHKLYTANILHHRSIPPSILTQHLAHQRFV